MVLNFQEFLLHEDAGWAYNPVMALKNEHSSHVTPAVNARHVVDAIPGLPWPSRPDGSVESFNGRCYEYTGLSPEESLGWAGSGRGGWSRRVHAHESDNSPGPWEEVLASILAITPDTRCSLLSMPH